MIALGSLVPANAAGRDARIKVRVWCGDIVVGYTVWRMWSGEGMDPLSFTKRSRDIPPADIAIPLATQIPHPFPFAPMVPLLSSHDLSPHGPLILPSIGPPLTSALKLRLPLHESIDLSLEVDLVSGRPVRGGSIA